MCGINNAYVLVKTSGSAAIDVLDKIRKMEGVKEASGVYGNYDIVVRVESEDVADMVIRKIRTLKGIVDTNTLIVAF
ncbi:MAG: hypothetical protein MSIBF_02295 [Candidatus Altiarchaeales archaeon IMC4]|nr:MAG: hypothetical protein MSIBF_02295 [Candidatus Altiarchaeales archaeon IMC4]